MLAVLAVWSEPLSRSNPWYQARLQGIRPVAPRSVPCDNRNLMIWRGFRSLCPLPIPDLNREFSLRFQGKPSRYGCITRSCFYSSAHTRPESIRSRITDVVQECPRLIRAGSRSGLEPLTSTVSNMQHTADSKGASSVCVGAPASDSR